MSIKERDTKLSWLVKEIESVGKVHVDASRRIGKAGRSELNDELEYEERELSFYTILHLGALKHFNLPSHMQKRPKIEDTA